MTPVVTPKKERGSHSGASPLTVSAEIAEAAASPLPKASALMCNLTNKAKSTPWNREYRRNNKKKSAKLIQFTNSCWNLLMIVSIRVFIKLCYSLKTWHMMELPGLNIPDTSFPPVDKAGRNLLPSSTVDFPDFHILRLMKCWSRRNTPSLCANSFLCAAPGREQRGWTQHRWGAALNPAAQGRLGWSRHIFFLLNARFKLSSFRAETSGGTGQKKSDTHKKLRSWF